MEDRDQIKPDEDVEAHRRGSKIKATDEGGEGGSDDFELHKRKSNAQDEGGESSDDDVELHRRGKLSK